MRDASKLDARRCAAIYAPYVTDTTISFESEPPSPTEMAERIAEAQRAHAWLVLEDGGRAVGWKHGRWHDVAWMQRTLGVGDDPPAEPR